MKKLTQQLKNAIAALAAADAGEMLTRRQMARVIHSRDDHHGKYSRQVALWLSAAVSKDVLDYTLSVCKRLDASITVLHPQGSNTDDAHKALRGQTARFISVNNKPEVALRHFVATHSQVVFLVLDGSDQSANGLAQRIGDLSVPIVVTAPVRGKRQVTPPHPATPLAA